jgi:hypothetical protein
MNGQHIEIWDKAENRNHSYWNFYALIVVAIAGWLFAKADRVESAEQVILTIGFVFFTLFNLVLIHGTAKLLEAVSGEMKRTSSKDKPDPLMGPLVNSIGKNRVLYSLSLHLVLDICVVIGIWT